MGSHSIGIKPFVESLSKCPKHGLHNPFKAPEMFVLITILFLCHHLSLGIICFFRLLTWFHVMVENKKIFINFSLLKNLTVIFCNNIN
ncbi:hypothetical protein DVH24_000027 [Malus domestica]|uniref:Uncharacterized protein n=1 Tax=Malus domestica TaxID=3750 RepID=A0A498IYM7_MALDO|nr:hypothetical protein DVH24_000027 [Malus domestica]